MNELHASDFSFRAVADPTGNSQGQVEAVYKAGTDDEVCLGVGFATENTYPLRGVQWNPSPSDKAAAAFQINPQNGHILVIQT